jgi:hypothetical protein
MLQPIRAQFAAGSGGETEKNGRVTKCSYGGFFLGSSDLNYYDKLTETNDTS